MGYGTGAIMAVPAEDERDWAFAANISCRSCAPWSLRRIGTPTGRGVLGDGVKINSGFLNGLDIVTAKARAIDWIEEKGVGERKVNYRLRDWLVSRQRFWGCPIRPSTVPITAWCRCQRSSSRSWHPTTWSSCRPGSHHSHCTRVFSTPPARSAEVRPVARRTPWTLSSIPRVLPALLRSLEHRAALRPAAAQHFMPVDQYIGGIEHAILHLSTPASTHAP